MPRGIDVVIVLVTFYIPVRQDNKRIQLQLFTILKQIIMKSFNLILGVLFLFSLNSIAQSNWNAFNASKTQVLFSTLSNSYNNDFLQATNQGMNFSNSVKDLPVNAEEMDFMGQNENLRVYPNPANSTINVEGKWDVRDNAELNIYDQSGRLVKRVIPRVNDAMGNATSIDVSDLIKGIYFVELSHTKGIQVERLMIM